MRTAALLIFLSSLPLRGAELHFPKNVKPGGELAARIALTENRLAHQPFDLDLVVQDVARVSGLERRFEEYEGDVSGRTLGSWSFISRLKGSRPVKLDSLFERIRLHQAAEGYFGRDQQKIGWDYWGRQIFGHGRLLGGLVQYYHLTRDQRALDAASRLGDYFTAKIPVWTALHVDNPWTVADKWVQWGEDKSDRQHFVKTHMTSILESLMMLYEIDPQQRYLDAGRSIFDLFPEFGHYHSHSYMNTMVGMAMLYSHTGSHDVLSRLYDLYWQDIVNRSSVIDGGMREWFPADHRTEGCSITDWIRLNLYLWRITRDAVYLDAAENAWFNALNFHQTANGAFGHAVCTPAGYEQAYSEAWWCCTMHGLWAYAELINFAAVCGESDLWFNFYAPLSFELRDMRFDMETGYPRDGAIRITCRSDAAAPVTTRLRIPEWADSVNVTLNNEPVKGTLDRGWFSFDHSWKKDDALHLRIGLSLRLVDRGGNDLLRRRQLGDHVYRTSFLYGPLLLAADRRHNRALPDLIVFDANEEYRPLPVEAGPFVLDRAHFEIPAVTAGERTTVHLNPMSEQTGYQVWTDEWRNFIRNGEQPIQREAVRIEHAVEITR